MSSRKSVIVKLIQTINIFQATNELMPIQVMKSFLMVWLHEGASLRELCDVTGVAQSTMSRHLLDLGERNRRMQPGLKLVEQKPDPMELRKNQYRLTSKGKALISEILQIWEEDN